MYLEIYDDIYDYIMILKGGNKFSRALFTFYTDSEDSLFRVSTHGKGPYSEFESNLLFTTKCDVNKYTGLVTVRGPNGNYFNK